MIDRLKSSATLLSPGRRFICTNRPCESRTSSVHIRTSLGFFSSRPHSLKSACRGEKNQGVQTSTEAEREDEVMMMRWSYLSEHLGEIVDISGAQSLSLEALRLQQVFSHVRRVDQHAMQRTLFIPVGLEHDLKRRDECCMNSVHFHSDFSHCVFPL